MDCNMKTRRLFRLMWYAYQVENLELDQETETAKKLRHKFVNEVTQKKESKYVNYFYTDWFIKSNKVLVFSDLLNY